MALYLTRNLWWIVFLSTTAILILLHYLAEKFQRFGLELSAWLFLWFWLLVNLGVSLGTIVGWTLLQLLCI